MPMNLLKKTPEELKKMYDAGLKMMYIGIETGSDIVLKKVTKGATSQTIIKVNWGWPKISGVMLCMVIFILIHEYIISSNFLPNWTLKSIIFIGYILALRLTGLISQKEIKGLLELMDKIMFRLDIKNSN